MPKLVGKIQNNDDIVNKKYVDDRTVVDSALSSTSTNPVQNKIINSALAGKASSAHTHSTKDLWIPTDAVQNGGPGTVDRFGLAETRACKTAFLPPEAITIEYTTDGGKTWTNYGATDTQKQELVACRYSGSFKYGGPSCTTVTNQIGLRITLNPTDRYCYVNMAYLWVNSVAHTCMVSLERSTIGAKTTFSPVNNGKQYQITGWTGGNMLYFPGSTFGGGSTQYSNTYAYRFTFLCTAVNSDWISAVPTIVDLRMYGTSTWTAPNEMMKTDHLYSWDRNKNATFPAAVTATNFIGTINGYSIAKSVPANAVFTDTTYNNATTSVAGLMSSTDKTKLDGIANGATANIGTITGITMNGTSKGTSGVVDLGTVITAHQDISGKQDNLIAGTNISIASDGKTISATDTTYSNATTSTAGLMSSSDKTKLDGLENFDNVFLLDEDDTSTNILNKLKDIYNKQKTVNCIVIGRTSKTAASYMENPIFIVKKGSLTNTSSTEDEKYIVSIPTPKSARHMTNNGYTYHNYRSTRVMIYVQNDTVISYYDDGTNSIFSTSSSGNDPYLATDYNYGTPYTPQYPGSPATKKYVDDTLGDIVYLIDTGSDISTFTNSGTYLIDATLNMSYTYMSGPSDSQIRKTTLIPLYKGDILFCSMDSTYIYWTIYAYADNKKWIVKCTKSTGYSTGNYSILLDTIGGDNLPVGTEVDYYGSTSDVPDGWEVATDSGEFLLYSSSGTEVELTLSDYYYNYDYLEILYRNNDMNYSSIKIYTGDMTSSSGSRYFNTICNTVSSTLLWQQVTTWSVNSGNKITPHDNKLIRFSNANVDYLDTLQNIYIYRVIGYKNRV